MNTYEIYFQLLGGAKMACSITCSSEVLAIEKAILNLKQTGYGKYLPNNPEKYVKVCTKLSK